MNQKKREKHIYILDDLRGIAILTVVFYHYFFVYFKNIDITNSFIIEYKIFNNYLNLGAYGVSLFFIVSGFVIPMSLKGKSRNTTIYNFFIRRFFRLYPTYWFSIILISSLVFLYKDSNAYTIKQIIINFTMLQDIFRVQNIDGVFWTLLIELKFYILTGFLFYIGYLNKINIIIIFFIISMVTLILGYYDGSRSFGNTLFSYLMLMYLGTSFYYYYILKINKYTLIYSILLVLLYFSINHLLQKNNEYGFRIGYSSGTIFAIFTFIVCFNYKVKLSILTTFFGNISYSFYLLHQVIGYLIIDKLLYHLSSPISQIIAFSIIVILSFLVNRYIEKTTNNFGHNYVKFNK